MAHAVCIPHSIAQNAIEWAPAHEAFDQSFKVKVGATTYPLSTVYHVERGKYSGTSKVDVTVKTP